MTATSTSTSITVASTGFTRFLLGELHCAGLRARLMAAEADSIAAALSGDFIDTNSAIEWAVASGIDLAAIASSAVTPT